MADDVDRERPFTDLRSTGLLWLINRAVFHPRGFALALVLDGNGEATGWRLLGDGAQPWRYVDPAVEDEKFVEVEGLFAEVARPRPTVEGGTDGRQ